MSLLISELCTFMHAVDPVTLDYVLHDLSQSPWTTFCMQGGCRTHSAKMLGEHACLQCLPIPTPMKEGSQSSPIPTNPDSPASHHVEHT